MAPPPKFIPPADAVPVNEQAQGFVPPADAVPVKKKEVSTLSSTVPQQGSVPSSALSGEAGASAYASTPATTIPLALTLQPKDLRVKTAITASPASTGSKPMDYRQGQTALMRNALQGFPLQLQTYNPLSSQINSSAVDQATGVDYGTEMSMMQGDMNARDFNDYSYSQALKTKDAQVNSYNQSVINDQNSRTIAENTPGTPEYNAKNFKGVALPVNNTETALDQSRRYYTNYLQQYNPQKLAEHNATVAGQEEGMSNAQFYLDLAKSKDLEYLASGVKGAMSIAQKTRANFDQEALMFSLQGVDQNLNNANSTLSTQYKPQLDIVDKINNWPVDANGQPIFKDAKEQQDYMTMVGELRDAPDFLQLYGAAAHSQSQMAEIAKAGRTYLDQYPQYKEQFNLTKEAERTGVEDLGWFRGDVLNPAIRTVASAAQSIAALPKEGMGLGETLTGGDSGSYNWADKLYDAASFIYGSKAAQYFPMGGTLQEGINPLTGETERIYKEGFLPSVVQSATQMGLIIAGGYATAGLTSGTATAATIGQVGSAAALSMNQFYEAGKSAGMSEKEALNYGLVSGIVSGLFMAVNPIGTTAASGLENVAQKSVGEYANALVRGEGTSAARAAALKELGNSIVGVNMVGAAQKISEYATNYIANTATGSNLTTGQNIGQDMWDVVTMSTVMGGVFGVAHHGGEIINPRAARNVIFREALFAAANDPVRYKEALMKMKENGVATDDRVQLLSAKIDRASAALASMPDGMNLRDKIDALPNMMIKQQLKEQEKTTDEALRPIVEEKIAQVDERLKQKAGLEEEVAPKKEFTEEDAVRLGHLEEFKKLDMMNERETKEYEELRSRAPKEEVIEEAPKAPEKDIASAFKKSADLYYDIMDSEGGSKKRHLAKERRAFLEANPSVKYIDENLSAINKELEDRGLITKEGNCP